MIPEEALAAGRTVPTAPGLGATRTLIARVIKGIPSTLRSSPTRYSTVASGHVDFPPEMSADGRALFRAYRAIIAIGVVSPASSVRSLCCAANRAARVPFHLTRPCIHLGARGGSRRVHGSV